MHGEGRSITARSGDFDSRSDAYAACPLTPAVRRRGVTLLEVLLALGLTVLLVGVISSAVHVHWTVFDGRRMEVEEVQVARAVLRSIASDLRDSVQSHPLDVSALASLTANVASSSGSTTGSGGGASSGSSQSSSTPSGGQSGAGKSGSNSGAGSGGQSGTSTSGGQSGTGASGGSSGSSTSGASGGTASGSSVGTAAGTGTASASGSTGTATTASKPGLYGSQYELQVDVSRLPRVDQYDPSLTASTGENSASGSGTVNIPSDVKTVHYYLRTADASGSGAAPQGGTAGASSGTGLVRVERDRAVASWAAQSGTAADTEGQLLAPEVNRLEFRYFDGTDWLTEWNSDERGGLPLAVEITLGLDPSVGTTGQVQEGASAQDTNVIDPNEFTYRMVVRLPAAEPASQNQTQTQVDQAGQGALGL